jgi:hypothetical protein
MSGIVFVSAPRTGHLIDRNHRPRPPRALRAAGVPGTLQYLRTTAYLHLLQGTDPLTRLTTPARQPGTTGQPGTFTWRTPSGRTHTTTPTKYLT